MWLWASAWTNHTEDRREFGTLRRNVMVLLYMITLTLPLIGAKSSMIDPDSSFSTCPKSLKYYISFFLFFYPHAVSWPAFQLKRPLDRTRTRTGLLPQSHSRFCPPSRDPSPGSVARRPHGTVAPEETHGGWQRSVAHASTLCDVTALAASPLTDFFPGRRQEKLSQQDKF